MNELVPHPSLAAERMRLHRERRRNGMRSLWIELRVTEIEALVRIGLLKWKRVTSEKVSGARTDRAELAKLLKRIEAGDLLIVTRLDRLARSARDPSMILTMLASDRSTVTPLSPPPHQGANRRTRHHPPADSDSCSTG